MMDLYHISLLYIICINYLTVLFILFYVLNFWYLIWICSLRQAQCWRQSISIYNVCWLNNKTITEFIGCWWFRINKRQLSFKVHILTYCSCRCLNWESDLLPCLHCCWAIFFICIAMMLKMIHKRTLQREIDQFHWTLFGFGCTPY